MSKDNLINQSPQTICMLYSHIAKPDDLHTEWRCQSTDEHNEGVARLCSSFAQPFGFDSIGYIMGLLHDKGKEQEEWQKYLQGVTGFNKDYANVRNGPHHAYVGAIIAQKHKKRCLKIKIFR